MFRLSFPRDAIRGRQTEFVRRLSDAMPTLMDQIGVQVMALSRQDYRTKARGGTGSDGISWQPLTRETIEARVRSRAPARRIVAQRKQLAEQIRQTRGKGSTRKIARLRERRKKLLDRLNKLVDREVAKHEIGVDTGLQRASAKPGYRGPDSKGGNVHRIDADEVTVGYGREYSGWFDEKRKLLPEELPDSWTEKLERIVTTTAETIAQEIER